MKLALFFLPIFLFSLSCAHNHKIETISKDLENKGIKVSIGKNEVSQDEIVDVLADKCHLVVGGRGQKKKECHSNRVGEARIIKIIDDKTALIEPLHGLTITSEMTVEKKK